MEAARRILWIGLSSVAVIALALGARALSLRGQRGAPAEPAHAAAAPTVEAADRRLSIEEGEAAAGASGWEVWIGRRLELEERIRHHLDEGDEDAARTVALRLLSHDPINELAEGLWLEWEAAREGSGAASAREGESGETEGRGAEPAEILWRWAAGEEGETALAAMSRKAERGSEEARRLLGPMTEAEARLREGISALLAGRLLEAEESLLLAAAAEEEVLGGARSSRLREALRDLARGLREEAANLEGKRRLRAAFDTLRRAQAADPEDVATLRALWGLEQQAERLAANETDCRRLRELLELTTPGRVGRRSVEGALERCVDPNPRASR